MVLILVLLCFVIFLFVLYAVTNDDFLLLRKNVTQEQVFNVAFLTAGVALFVSRLAFVLEHFSPNYFNPLVFFLFWYFPGLSLAGACLGGVIFMTYYASIRKLPLLRLLDFFAYALLWTMPFGFFFGTVLSLQKPTYPNIAGFAIFTVLVLLFSLLFYPLFKKTALREGTMSMLIIFFISLVMVSLEVLHGKDTLFNVISIEAVLFCLLAVFSFVSISRKEKLHRKLRKR